MSTLIVKKIEVQLSQVKSAKGVLELREMEMLEEIKRIKNSLEIQNKEIIKLEDKLKELRQE